MGDIVKLHDIEHFKDYKNNLFFLIAGPCVIETEEITYNVASYLKELTDKYSIPFVFKASYKKANRSDLHSFTGIGEKRGLELLARIREELKVPVITDIHETSEAKLAASYNIDILQIPAFLSRQTDLLLAAGETGKYVNIKKGQFLSPESVMYAAQKVWSTGNKNVIITERGTQFGYSDLIVDFRGIPVMRKFGYPVVMDVTHSLQQPNQSSGVTGGRPELISTIARAAVATGVDGLFIETHPDPSVAKSDGANMLKLDKMEELIKSLIPISEAVYPYQNL